MVVHNDVSGCRSMCASGARASARRQVASCCARLLIASATSERVCPAPTGLEQPSESTRSVEERRGDDALAVIDIVDLDKKYILRAWIARLLSRASKQADYQLSS